MGTEFETSVEVRNRGNEKLAYGYVVFKTQGWQIKADSSKLEFITDPTSDKTVLQQAMLEIKGFIELARKTLHSGSVEVVEVARRLADKYSALKGRSFKGTPGCIILRPEEDSAWGAKPQATFGVRLGDVPTVVDQGPETKLTAYGDYLETEVTVEDSPFRVPDGERATRITEIKAPAGTFMRPEDAEVFANVNLAIDAWIVRQVSRESDRKLQAQDWQSLRGFMYMVTRYLIEAHEDALGAPEYVKEYFSILSRTDFNKMWDSLGDIKELYSPQAVIEIVDGFCARIKQRIEPNRQLLSKGSAGKSRNFGPSVIEWLESIRDPKLRKFSQRLKETSTDRIRGIKSAILELEADLAELEKKRVKVCAAEKRLEGACEDLQKKIDSKRAKEKLTPKEQRFIDDKENQRNLTSKDLKAKTAELADLEERTQKLKYRLWDLNQDLENTAAPFLHLEEILKKSARIDKEIAGDTPEIEEAHKERPLDYRDLLSRGEVLADSQSMGLLGTDAEDPRLPGEALTLIEFRRLPKESLPFERWQELADELFDQYERLVYDSAVPVSFSLGGEAEWLEKPEASESSTSDPKKGKKTADPTDDYGSGMSEEDIRLYTIRLQPGVENFLRQIRMTLRYAPGIQNSCLYESVFYAIYGTIPQDLITELRGQLAVDKLGSLEEMVTFESDEWLAASKFMAEKLNVNRTIIVYSGQEGFARHEDNIGDGGEDIYILHYGAHFSPLTELR